MATRSALGPLTTTYTPSAVCTALALDPSNIAEGIVGLYQAQGCRTSKILQDTPACWPSATVRAPSPPFNGWGFYSPGLICPSGYTTACSATASSDGSQQGSFNFQFPLAISETAAGCCPSGYECTSSDTGQTCLSIATTGNFDVGVCDGSSIGSTRSLPVPGTWTLASMTPAPITEASLYAPMIQINWKASDRPIPAVTTSTIAPSRETSVTQVTQVTPSPSINSNTTLSTGAKVGIGLSIGFIALLLCVAFGFFIFRRKQPGPIEIFSAEAKRLPVEVAEGTLKSELPTQFSSHELESGLVFSTQKAPVELSGASTPEKRPG